MKLFTCIVVLLMGAAINAARIERVEHTAHALCDEIAISFNNQFDMMYDPDPAGPHFFIAHSAASAGFIKQLQKISVPACSIAIERVTKPVSGVKVHIRYKPESHSLQFSRSSLFANQHILQIYLYRKQNIVEIAQLMQYSNVANVV